MDIPDLLFNMDSDGLFQKYCSDAVNNYWKTKRGKKMVCELLKQGFSGLTPDERFLIKKSLKE